MSESSGRHRNLYKRSLKQLCPTESQCPLYPTDFDSDLLRAVPASYVISDFGNLLRSPHGKRHDFEKSEPSEKIEYFLSHSWSACGLFKYLSLCWLFNLDRALLVSFFTVILSFVTVFTLKAFDIYMHPLFPKLCAPASGMTVFFMFFFLSPLNSKKTRVFLDKCCINQIDPESKRLGIENIEVFLEKSDRLVVLWSPDYFKRLWCIYEIACFLYINQNKHNSMGTINTQKMRFHREIAKKLVFLPMRTLCSMLCTVPFSTVKNIFKIFDSEGFVSSIYFKAFLELPLMVMGAFCCWKMMEDQCVLRKQIESFKLKSSNCSVKSDKQVLLSNIEKMYKSRTKFEQFASKAMEKTSELSMGSSLYIIPFKCLIVTTLSYHFHLVGLSIAEALKSDSSLGTVLLNLCSVCSIVLVFTFLTNYLVLFVARCLLSYLNSGPKSTWIATGILSSLLFSLFLCTEVFLYKSGGEK